jgi:hypothetical protein
MVFNAKKHSDKEHQIRRKLIASGNLTLEQQMSRDNDEILLLITADER